MDLGKALFWSNSVYIAAVCVAATATFFVSFFASRVGAVKDSELHRFQEQSKAQIALANARIAEANKETEQLRQENLATEEKLTQTKRELEQEAIERLRLEEQMAMRLEMERRERSRLERDVADRSLDPKQLRGMLEKFAGSKVVVEYTVNSPEVKNLAGAIATGLEWAKWEGPRSVNMPDWVKESVIARPLSKHKQLFENGTFETGIMVGIPIDPNKGPAAIALLDALQALGIESVRRVTNVWEPAVVYVLVGSKRGLIVHPSRD